MVLVGSAIVGSLLLGLVELVASDSKTDSKTDSKIDIPKGTDSRQNARNEFLD